MAHSLDLLRSTAVSLACAALLASACADNGAEPTLPDDTDAADTGGGRPDAVELPDAGPPLDVVPEEVVDPDAEVEDVPPEVDTEPDVAPDVPAAPVCGNGIVEEGEACDDGNRVDDDACRNDCTRPRCGDGIVDVRMGRELLFTPVVTLPGVGTGFVCDDGSTCPEGVCDVGESPFAPEHGICRALGFERAERVVWGGGPGEGVEPMLHAYNWECLEYFCRPSDFLDTRADCSTAEMLLEIECFGASGEACDDGDRNADLPDACRTDCQLPRCGDGIVDTGEGCDDGRRNAQAPDRCRLDCSLPTCGDGIVDEGEACDDGNDSDADFCTNACELPRCGDGVVQPGEQCDDGDANSDEPNAACRTNCRVPRCGDGVVDDGEECDDGNFVNNDACTNSCRDARCGDGITQAVLGEECDDGNDIDTDFCLSSCLLPICGDGIVSGDEVCDEGDANSAERDATCRPDCSAQRCGDGVVDTGEPCDDGNLDNLDVCSNACTVGTCGDGLRQRILGEQCDGGPNCTPECLLIDGATFPGRAIYIGHDYFRTNPFTERLLWNAVLLSEVDGPIRIAGYAQYAERGEGREVANAVDALQRQAAEAGRTLEYTEVLLADELPPLLDAVDVVVVFEQPYTNDATLGAVASAWAEDLEAFLQGGGVVIVLDQSGPAWRILGQDGRFLPVVGPRFVSSSSQIDVLRPGELLTDGLGERYPAASNTRGLLLDEEAPSYAEVEVYAEGGSNFAVVILRSYPAE